MRSGPKKQIRALLEQQEALKKDLQPEGAPDDAKTRSNHKIITIIEQIVKPELERKKE